MAQTDHNDFVPAIADIAREAGALLMDYFRQRVSIEYKGEADLVTEADRKSEILIRERIRARWPGHDILGEEQGLVDTAASIAGMSIRSMEPRISRMAFRCSASRWRWSTRGRWLRE